MTYQNDQDNGKFKMETGKGGILEVDLEYPKEMQKLHDDFHLPQRNLQSKKNGSQNTKLNC